MNSLGYTSCDERADPGRIRPLRRRLHLPSPGDLERALDGLLRRRPGFASWIVRYGVLLFVAIAALFVVIGAASSQDRGQEIVYATSDGSIVSVNPDSDERTVVFSSRRDGGFAAAPLLNGGSRSLSFTALRGEGTSLRGDLYAADLARGTRAAIQVARDGEAFLYGGYSTDREWLVASRFSREENPNVVVLNGSGASVRSLEAGSGDPPPILGPSWTAQNSLYAWREGDGEDSSLTAYNFFEQRQVVVYRTDGTVGLPSYNFESNTTVFDMRPSGDPRNFEKSRLVALIGTEEMPVSGADGLGLYDPSIPVPELDYGMAVLWTDGAKSGVGVFDPATWTFTKTPVRVEEGSRKPQISYDGTYVATTDASGSRLTVRRMDDGEVALRLDDAQPPDAALNRLREAGYNVPQGAEELVPAGFTWRSFEGS